MQEVHSVLVKGCTMFLAQGEAHGGLLKKSPHSNCFMKAQVIQSVLSQTRLLVFTSESYKDPEQP